MKVRPGFTSSTFGEALPISKTILYIRLGSGISCALGKSMAESTLGMGRACADCARVELGSTIKIANKASAPIRTFFILLSINWDFRLGRADSGIFYLFKSGPHQYFLRVAGPLNSARLRL